jgi:hypothetical protein
MKRTLVVAGLALALGLGYASAQNITKSLQGSQDPRGPVGLDTSNAAYFAGHINGYGQVPATTLGAGIQGCGTNAALATGSTDVAGSVWLPASSTSCFVVFGSPFNNNPACVVNQSTTSVSPVAIAVVTTISNFKVNFLTAATSFYYICIGNS